MSRSKKGTLFGGGPAPIGEGKVFAGARPRAPALNLRLARLRSINAATPMRANGAGAVIQINGPMRAACAVANGSSTQKALPTPSVAS